MKFNNRNVIKLLIPRMNKLSTYHQNFTNLISDMLNILQDNANMSQWSPTYVHNFKIGNLNWTNFKNLTILMIDKDTDLSKLL